jgi:hypothetical protein
VFLETLKRTKFYRFSEKITITRIHDVLACPECNKSWKKRLQLKYHFDTSDCLGKFFQDQGSHAITPETLDDDSGDDEDNLSAENGQDWTDNEEVSPSVFQSVPSVPQKPFRGSFALATGTKSRKQPNY